MSDRLAAFPPVEIAPGTAYDPAESRFAIHEPEGWRRAHEAGLGATFAAASNIAATTPDDDDPGPLVTPGMSVVAGFLLVAVAFLVGAAVGPL